MISKKMLSICYCMLSEQLQISTFEIQKILTPSLVHQVERSSSLLKDNQILYKFC
jgi:hypothetical protein